MKRIFLFLLVFSLIFTYGYADETSLEAYDGVDGSTTVNYDTETVKLDTKSEDTKAKDKMKLSLDYKEAIIKVGDKFSLPKFATAISTDGAEKKISLKWNREVDTSKEGTYKFIGRAKGTPKKLEFTLVIKSEILRKTITSPNGNISVNFSNEDGKPYYSINSKKENIIKKSGMGFEFANSSNMIKDFNLNSCTINSFEETWKPVWGQRSKIVNNYNELTVNLQEKDNLKRQLKIVFRVFDDGVGFRYEIPEQENVDDIIITDELTEFSFTGDHKSWWIENDWDSYEYTYNTTPISEVDEISTPFTMKTSNGTYISIHEAALYDYSGMALKKSDKDNKTLESALCPWYGSEVKVKGINEPLKSVKTPWRTITITDSAAKLAESDLILNLNEPNAIKDTSWIKPMKYVGIWWEMHIGKSTWHSGDKHGATTENAKKYIDFASENDIEGLLVEGWNEGWDGDWKDQNFLVPYEDFKLDEVLDYCREKNVNYIMHNETGGVVSGDSPYAYSKQMKDAYEMYQEKGIHAIKSGYVADGGVTTEFGKQHHHGQYMVNHYNNAVKLAADYQISINTHEPIKDTGISRTYPNWVSREGAQGQEYNAWSAGNPPEHATILPFTRLLSGPMDYTPGIFDVKIHHAPANRVHSTRAKQLALMVIMYSPLQMVTDLPENYKDENGEMIQEFKFIKDVPSDWDETIFQECEIGDYVTVARKAKGLDEWYIGCVTDENPRDIEIDLEFLGKGRYIAEIYEDGIDADYEKNPTSVTLRRAIVNSKSKIKASMIKSGGMAVRIYPATNNDLDKLVTSVTIPETYAVVTPDDSFKLPEKATVTRADGSSTQEEIKWDNKVDTSKVENYTFIGTVKDLDLKVSFLLTVEYEEIEIPEGHVRIHYSRDEDDYKDWTLWLSGDTTNPGNSEEWPNGMEQTNRDAKGIYFDVPLTKDVKELSFIFVNKKTGEQDGNEKHYAVDPKINEIWCNQGSDEIVTIPRNILRIHYKRDNVDYDNWTLWLWHDTTDPGEEWPKGMKPTGKDDFGVYWDVPLVDNAARVSFLMVDSTTGTKDGGDKTFPEVQDYRQVWCVEGTDEIYLNPDIN